MSTNEVEGRSYRGLTAGPDEGSGWHYHSARNQTHGTEHEKQRDAEDRDTER